MSQYFQFRYYNYTLSVNGKAEVHKDSYPRDYLTDVIRYFEMLSGILSCDQVFWNVIRYFKMWSGILKCDLLFWNVIRHFEMWSGILRCDILREIDSFICVRNFLPQEESHPVLEQGFSKCFQIRSALPHGTDSNIFKAFNISKNVRTLNISKKFGILNLFKTSKMSRI